MKIKEMISNCIVALIVIGVGLYVLNFEFKFKYVTFWDWLYRRNPIIYYEGKRLT